MSNKDYQEMVEFFKERNLTVPSIFKQFADVVVQEPGMSRWRIGEPPVAWPFASPGESDESGESRPITSGSFTSFVSVGFTLYEPWDDIDDEYGDAIIDFRLATRDLLLDVRVSEGHNVREGGGNAWDVDPDATWIPFWNEMMRDLTKFAKKVDLFAEFDHFSDEFTPARALCFEPGSYRIAEYIFAEGVENLFESTYVDGPPGLAELLRG
jgi:hypothetical protein